MSELGTKWRWEFTDGFSVTSVGEWRETRAEAVADGKGRTGWLNCQIETFEVDKARWAREERERGRA